MFLAYVNCESFTENVYEIEKKKSVKYVVISVLIKDNCNNKKKNNSQYLPMILIFYHLKTC